MTSPIVWGDRVFVTTGVAEDTQPGLENSQMGLYFGVGKNYAAGTFWSGLIDDIRIYNRAVSPKEITAMDLSANPQRKKHIITTHH